MPERPINNLPPGSQPWARDIAKAVDLAQFDATKANMNNKNAFKTINATLDQLAEQLVQIQEQQEYLASLISRDAFTGSLSKNTVNRLVSNTGVWVFQAGPSLTVEVPTGKFRILLSTDSATAEANTPGVAQINTGITYGYTGPVSLSPALGHTAYFTATTSWDYKYVNGPLMRFGTANVTPGTYTVTGYYAQMYTGSDTGFRGSTWSDLRLAVDVLGNN